MPAVDTGNVGFLLAKASQRWNELLYERFRGEGFAEVRPAYGSILVPLFEDDGLRMGELAARARLAKQTMTTMVRLLERDGLVERRPDREDARAVRVHLTGDGLARLNEMRAVREAVLEARLQTLTDSERELLAAALLVLDKLIEEGLDQ